MFERFTEGARRAVVLAQHESRALNHNFIGAEHLFLGLIQVPSGNAAKALESVGLDLASVRDQVVEMIGRGTHAVSGHIPFTPPAKMAMELSLREAMQLGHNHIGTEHLLLGLLREGQGVPARVLNKLGADLSEVRRAVAQLPPGVEEGLEPPEFIDPFTGRISNPARMLHNLPGGRMPGPPGILHKMPGGVAGHINPLGLSPRDLGLVVLLIAGVLSGDSHSSLYSAGAVAAIVGVVLTVVRALPWSWRQDERWALVVRIPAVLAMGTASVLFFASAI